jgi:hypothetical protein
LLGVFELPDMNAGVFPFDDRADLPGVGVIVEEGVLSGVYDCVRVLSPVRRDPKRALANRCAAGDIELSRSKTVPGLGEGLNETTNTKVRILPEYCLLYCTFTAFDLVLTSINASEQLQLP